MKDQQANKPQPQPEYANLDSSELSSNQETIVLPWTAGERKLAVKWVCPVYNQYSTDAGPTGKK